MTRATQDPCYTVVMANLTIAVDDQLLHRARVRAAELGTSVNAVLREYLESFAGPQAMQRRMAIVENAQKFPVVSAHGPRTWSRDELHER